MSTTWKFETRGQEIWHHLVVAALAGLEGYRRELRYAFQNKLNGGDLEEEQNAADWRYASQVHQALCDKSEAIEWAWQSQLPIFRAFNSTINDR